MSAPNPREVVTTKALSIWVAAVLVYIVAIAGRTSFGVAGLDAIDRFGVTASQIAVFTSVQLGVYAFAQIPTGLLIDRFGPRKLLVVGAIVMGVGQVLLGFTSSYWVAIAARVLIGAGDATAFLSVMRILPYWFPLHRTPMFTQVTVSLGQVGQFLSAVPFLWLLGYSGWTVAFVTLGAVGILIGVAAAVAVADSPEKLGILEPLSEQPGESSASVGKQLATVFRSPVAWQAFFIHYIGMLTPNVFIMLWGMPMMTQGMGITPIHAGWVLTAYTVFIILIGPLHGSISARARGTRDWTAIVFALIHIVGWFVFFAFGTGLASMLILIFVMAACTPSSNYGFDIVREFLDRKVVATATGLGNMGGFISAMVGAQIFGIILDHRGSAPDYGFGDFRVASLAVLAIWTIGIVGVIITHILRARSGGTRPPVKAIEED
ncbi:MFS transporter [Corynebacterium flavescens]|uniref:Lysosomal dipeptide transporter MFSD1 n=1 Tax=Corynebacterium flavescens TaxID=28028 RepID=A0A1L7CN55_CORFL|nr:MFS transporter [Corynebacterium flavescens]APT87245.1 MFS transporter permease [Corynebacterium flavescens]KAA8721478.1 MFS transporter [Corynebacterium flavescens]GEB98213.1 MFS transporter [Corynebacterium flavescens]